MIEVDNIKIVNLGTKEEPMLDVLYWNKGCLEYESLFTTTSADNLIKFIKEKISWT